MKLLRRWKSPLVVLLVLAALGLLVAYFGAREVLKRHILSWRTDGLALSESGDHERAADMLGRYLRRRPGDTEAVRAFVKSREAAELPNGLHLAESANALRVLLAEEPGNLDDRQHLLDLYVKLDRRPEALGAADDILKKTQDPRALELKAQVLVRMARDREALAVAEQWAKVAPNELAPHMQRLTLRARLGHAREAIVADAAALREAAGDDPRHYLLQGFAHALVGETADAAAWLRAAARHEKLDAAHARIVVEQFDALGLSEDSLAVLERLVKQGGDAPLRHALARRQWELNRWQQVTETLADFDCAAADSDPTLVAFKATALARQWKKDESDACRKALEGRKQAAARAWTLLLKRELDGAGVDNRQVVAECRAALILDPDNAYLDYYLGDANARLGEIDLAMRAWRVAWARYPAWSVPSVRLVEALLQKGQPEEALAVASAAARNGPGHAASVIALARAWAAGIESGAAAQQEELARLVGEVQKRVPGEAQTLLIQVQLLAQQGQKQQAAEVVRSAAARQPPPDEQTFLSLASMSRRHALGVEAECFDRSEKAHGLTPALAYARAVDKLLTAGEAGGAGAGAKLLDESAARAGKADDVRWRLAKARFLDISGGAGAREAWVALGDAFPNDLAVQQAAVSARSVRGDWDFLGRSIDRLKALTGESSLGWRLAEARLMVEAPRTDSDYADAARKLNDIVQEHPQLPEPYVLLARALVQMKRLDGAIDRLTTAARLDPTSVPIALQLSSLLQSRGDFERVRQELDRAAPYLRSASQRQQAALLLAQQGNQDRAVQLLEEQRQAAGAATQPAQGANANPQDNLVLAALYRRQGELGKAEAVVRRLLDREPPDLGAVEFGAFLYASQGRRKEAEEVLSRLERMTTLPPGIKELVWGSYSAQTGDLAAAERHYAAAAQQWPDNPAVWRVLAATQAAQGKAAEALATIEQALKKLPEDKSLAAVREQGKLLKETHADPALRAQVLAFIRDPLNGGPTVELLRTMAEGRRSNDAERTVAGLRKLVEAQPRFLPARVQLVQVQAQMGRVGEAVATAKQAMVDFPTTPVPAQVAAQLALSAGRWQDAQSAASTWKERAPADAAAADVAAAKAHLGMQQYPAALALLEPRLAAAKAEPQSEVNAEVLAVYAMALGKSGRQKDAGDLLWPLAAESAAWRGRWIGAALELPETKDAAAWLDRVGAVVKPDAVGERVLLADAYDRVGERAGDAALRRKASEAFRQLADGPGATAQAVLAAAAQAERAGDATAAEAYYRRSLEKEPTLFVAHNNLANLIVARGGDAKEAMKFAGEALRLQPRRAVIYDTVALVRSRAGDARGAAGNMKIAVALEPDNAKWWVRLAQYNLDAGDPGEAAKAVAAVDDRRLDVQGLPGPLRDQFMAIRRQLRGSRPSPSQASATSGAGR